MGPICRVADNDFVIISYQIYHHRSGYVVMVACLIEVNLDFIQFLLNVIGCEIELNYFRHLLLKTSLKRVLTVLLRSC
jgi:hypothetical protein